MIEASLISNNLCKDLHSKATQEKTIDTRKSLELNILIRNSDPVVVASSFDKIQWATETL